MEASLELIVPLFVFAIPITYTWAQYRVLKRWQGGFRILAGIPLIGWAIWLVKFGYDVACDPTSHNLFPFEIAMGVAMAGTYLGMLALIRLDLRRFKSTMADRNPL